MPSSTKEERSSRGEDVKNRKPSCTTDRNVKLYINQDKNRKAFNQKKSEVPYDPAIPLVGI